MILDMSDKELKKIQKETLLRRVKVMLPAPASSPNAPAVADKSAPQTGAFVDTEKDIPF